MSTETKEKGHSKGEGNARNTISISKGKNILDEDTITVPQIRELGNLPANLPVIEIDPDNNERTLAENEVITLKPGHRYGKRLSTKEDDTT